MRRQRKLARKRARQQLGTLDGVPWELNELDLEAELCRSSLYDFVKRFWRVVNAENPVWNWHIKELCDLLQEVAERVFRGERKKYDVVVNMPPGTTKSMVCSVMFPAWVWTRMPSARTIAASYAHDLALDLSQKCRDVVQSDKYRKLFGDVELRDDQNAKGWFKNRQLGERFCCSTNAKVTGKHAYFIIIDDPLDPGRAYSDKDLKTANRWISETLSQRKIDKAITVTICVMQRLHQNDPSAVMLEKSKKRNAAQVFHMNLPGEIPLDADLRTTPVRPRRLHHYYRDGLLDPVRLPREVLDEQVVTLGEYGYASQILQTPVPRGGGAFKVDKLKLEEAPARHLLKQVVRSWDKAGTKDGEGAYTVGALLGVDLDGRFWVLDVVRGRWSADEREKVIKLTAELDVQKYGPKMLKIVVEQEPGSGGKESAEATARRLAGFRVYLERPTGNKELRAENFSVQVNTGNVWVARAPWNSEYVEELRFFPRSRYKDQVDASSGAFAMLARPKLRVGGVSELSRISNDRRPNSIGASRRLAHNYN